MTAITPTLRELVSLLVHAFEAGQTDHTVLDRDLSYTSAVAYAYAIVVVAREGADAPGEQMNRAAMAGELISALDGEWNADTRDLQALDDAVTRRLEQLISHSESPTNAEILDEEILRDKRDHEIRLEIAREIIPKFGTAAYRWLGPDSTDMARFAAEQRADVLANMLLMHLLTDECIDPMRIAQNVRNDAKANGTVFSGQAISKRIFQVIA